MTAVYVAKLLHWFSDSLAKHGLGLEAFLFNESLISEHLWRKLQAVLEPKRRCRVDNAVHRRWLPPQSGCLWTTAGTKADPRMRYCMHLQQWCQSVVSLTFAGKRVDKQYVCARVFLKDYLELHKSREERSAESGKGSGARVWGYYPRENFEIWDAVWCILATNWRFSSFPPLSTKHLHNAGCMDIIIVWGQLSGD